MNIFIIGDLHGDRNPVRNFYNNYIKNTPKEQEENWLICLGDFGANYFGDYRDRNFKKNLERYPFNYFVIRGNHEMRAADLAAVYPDLWEEVLVFGNTCLREKAYPDILYAKDQGGIYDIAGRKTLVIPGAYSVDKYYRLRNGWGWFANEQLDDQEKMILGAVAAGQHFDLVLSHTCPFRYMPTDLFLNCIDQKSVDNSMEHWMDELHDKITFGLWCWGHYHSDRIEAPHCEMFMHEVEPLEHIEDRWYKYDQTGELDWWVPKSPNYYMFVKNKEAN